MSEQLIEKEFINRAECPPYFDVEQEFFIIDSDNLRDVKTKLYGYSVQDSGIYDNENLTETAAAALNGCGVYVYICVVGGGITIQQDFNGSYGIYLFKKDNYFALSNSFLRLLEHLKTKYPLSLNRDYADTLLVNGLVGCAYTETAVNEIALMAKNSVITIDIETKALKIDYIDYKENSVELDSAEGMKILDNWAKRQTTTIRNLAAKTNQITVDLSGGFDTRMTLALLLMSGIDLNKIRINSANDNLHCHPEDYEIASSIADYFGFKLNNSGAWSEQAVPYSLSDIINIAFYTKLTFHKEMYFKYRKYAVKRYRFSGAGGEIIRSYPNESAQDYLNHEVNGANKYSKIIAKEMSDAISRLISDIYKAMQEKYKIKDSNSIDCPWHLYEETRCRSHYGKASVESYFSNVYDLNPLIDPDLCRIKLCTSECSDNRLLLALIYTRYCPKLLDFKIEGGRSISQETIRFAQEINKKFPIDKSVFDKTVRTDFNVELSDQSVIDTLNNGEKRGAVQWGEPDKYLKRVFDSNSFRSLFCTYFDDEIYRFADKWVTNHNFFPMRECYAVIGLTKVIEDIMVSNGSRNSLVQSLDNFIERDYYSTEINIDDLKNYITARIDIKIFGDNPDLELVSTSDDSMKMHKPEWLQKGGLGYTIESCKGYLSLVFKSSTGGRLTVNLLGRDVRDGKNNRIPYWIHYYDVRYNNEAVFDGIKSAWHDKPLRLESQVKAGEHIMLYVEFSSVPHKSNRVKIT